MLAATTTTFALALTAMAPPPPAASPTVQPSARQNRRKATFDDPIRADAYRRAQAMGDTGVVLGSVGVAVGLLVSLPTWAAYKSSLRRADAQRYRVELEAPLREADRRLNTLRISLGVTAALVASGTTLAVVGYRRRARLLHDGPRRVSLLPAMGGSHYGAAALVRF